MNVTKRCMTFVCALLFIFSFCMSASYAESEKPQFTEEFGRLPTITYQGKTYQAKAKITSILLIGYDMPNNKVKPTGYRGGGQSDFMLLVVIDHHDKVIYQLQFDRDMMYDIPVLGLTGKEMGRRNMQLCLAHCYGANILENDAHVRECAEEILCGIKIDGTISMRMGRVDKINHILGGVKVVVEDDFSDIDPTITMGEIVLTDKQAMAFVRGRSKVGSGLNEDRMRRQRTYMRAAYEQAVAKFNANKGFVKQLVNGMADFTDSSLGEGRLVNELNKALTYELVPVYNFEGEHYIGANGFMEFHPYESSIMAFVTSAFCNPME